MRPMLHVPRHPLRLARFGLPAAMPATLLARKFRTEQARALFGRLRRARVQPADAAAELVGRDGADLRGHHYGWPVARGGSRAISDALAAVVEEHGGRSRPGGA